MGYSEPMLLGLALSLFLHPVPLAPPQSSRANNLLPENWQASWSGNLEHWTWQDGVLTGHTPEGLQRTEYLFWNGEASDFELTFDYWIDGGNSGVQYRSTRLENDDVYGYQADIEDGPNYTGILYESGGRAIAAKRGESLRFHRDGRREVGAVLGDAAALQESIQSDGWNRYRIIAFGPRLIHEINGVRMIDVHDEHPERSRKNGTFALQLHSGPSMTIRYRNMNLRKLEGAAVPAGLKEWPAATQTPAQPEWVWPHRDQLVDERIWFFQSFELKQDATVVGGAFSADNHFKLHIDGRPHGQGDNWAAPTAIAAGMRLEAGWHGVAIEAWNDGGPAGLIGSLELQLDDGTRRSIVTSTDWLSWSSEPADWPRLDLDAIPEGAKALMSYGTSASHSGPWNDVLAPKVAPAAEGIVVPEGFVVERLYSAQPGEGSWVCMTFGPDGKIYLSPQSGKLMSMDVSALLGQAAQSYPAGVIANGAHVAQLQPPVKLDLPVHSAQGLEWAYDSLYVNVVAPADRDGGLHQLHDSDGDGVLDSHKQLARSGPPTEHGVHGIRLAPDGCLYVIHGNYVGDPVSLDGQSLLIDGPVVGADDDGVLLERYWDPRGHAHGIQMPAGVLYRVSPDGQQWQRVSVGMRNAYDIAVSSSGEVFSYDADMEWDLGMPWYRSPRVIHCLPGVDFGWRSGSAKFPAEYPDTMPPLLETDLASPVGVELGEGSAFPNMYQDALFLGDWSWGRITYAMLEPNGVSYSGTYHDFLQGRGVAVTDLEFGPDGNLWFIIGGRGTQSGLYRVRPETPNAQPRKLAAPPLQSQRLALKVDPSIREALDSPDRILRLLARNALMQNEPDGTPFIARWSTTIWEDDPRIEQQARIRAELRLFEAQRPYTLSNEFYWSELAALDRSHDEVDRMKWLALRTAMLVDLEQVDITPFLESESAAFPTGDDIYDRELARLLVAHAAITPERLLPMLDGQHSQEAQIHYFAMMAEVADQMDVAQAIAYQLWQRRATALQGGLSANGFISAIAERARSKMSEQVRSEADLALSQIPAVAPQPLAVVNREHVRDWNINELSAAMQGLPTGDAKNGARVFGQALCIQCHRVAGKGGSLGPDLTAAARRFSERDLLEAIVDPMKDRTDQYGALEMPAGLLNTFTAKEIADLTAFLEAARWPAD